MDIVMEEALPQSQASSWYGGDKDEESPLIAHTAETIHKVLDGNVNARDLASLEMTSKYFRKPVSIYSDPSLSITERVALDMCQKKTLFRIMNREEKNVLRERCGGSWKLVLHFLSTDEACTRRGKCQAIAGPGHSVVVTQSGVVYSFGYNNCGQLGHGTTNIEWKPRLIRSLQGIRIINAAAGVGRTILVTDMGQVFAFGRDSFVETEHDVQGSGFIATPQPVKSLEGIFVVQVVIGHLFTAFLSREGRVYTISWGVDAKLGHNTDSNDRKPHLLKGALEHIPVVQIAAGYCYMLALACRPSGMSVYSVGCGQGGKLGHGTKTDEGYPRLLVHLQTLNLEPVAVAAGVWHASVLGNDGRVCTWGWGLHGCLGYGKRCQIVPKIIEPLEGIKAIHITAGAYTTFVTDDNGNVYSFGYADSCLEHWSTAAENQDNEQEPVVASLQERKEQVVHISTTNSVCWHGHTFALTRSGNLYAFGAGSGGQLGTKLPADQTDRLFPVHLDIDLS